ncbi:MAG: replicative DNA helicase [Oscillospiraceae bacterium]|nr:replicative DNA helicase [Oscillospiraceae bacterium]
MEYDASVENLELLPYSQEAEQSVLGSILVDPDIFNVVNEYIKKSDYFYRDIHKQIFSAMSSMFLLGSSIDYVTVLEQVEKLGIFGQGESAKLYLARLMDMVPTVSNIEDYCKIMADKYNLRRLIILSRRINDAASSTAANSRLILETAEQEMYEIRGDAEKSRLTKLGDIIPLVYDNLARMHSLDEKDKEKPYIMTGFSHLDAIITGLNPSDLVLIAARPSVGKSSFALNIAANAARHTNKAVTFFSLEMSKEQLAERLLASEARVDAYKFKKGDVKPADWEPLSRAASSLCGMNMYFDDTASITVSDIKSRARRLNDLGIIIIDYLQLMSSTRRIENRVQEVSAITRNLKIMAKELNVPVILLSQLSRETEKRKEHRPMLSDLRESGSIEQDADIVMFLYRDVDYNPQTASPDIVECIIRKNRHGATGTVNFNWINKYTLFTSMETRYEDED